MSDKKRLELLEQMILDTPNALSIAVPTLTLNALMKVCWERDVLKKQKHAEKERADYYEKQLRQLEMQVAAKSLGLSDFTRGSGSDGN